MAKVTKFVKGDRVLYYGSVVRVLAVNGNNTAYVESRKERFAVDFSLLKKMPSDRIKQSEHHA